MAIGKALLLKRQGYWAQVNALEQLADRPQPNTPTTTLKTTPPPIASRGKRRIYLLHSGMNDPQCTASQSLKNGLLGRGIPTGDIISLPSPYPSFEEGLSAAARNVSLFRDSSQPDSPVAQSALETLTRSLIERGVSPQDELVWLGHSAGGQMGLTLANSLEKNTPYRMDTVITLGSPVCTNLAPHHVKVRQYVSPGDGVLVATNQAPVSPDLTAEAFAGNLDSNDRLRIYPNIAHSDWVNDSRVLDRIVAEGHPQPVNANTPSSSSWLGKVWQKIWHGINGFLDQNLGFSFEAG